MPLSSHLHPLALAESFYRRAVTRRQQRFSAAPQCVGCPVVSVGNLTTGGTGKTPTVQWLARSFQDRGAKVGIVARGYRGSLSKNGALVSDGKRIFLDAREAGDEPLLHARALPEAIVTIGRDRVQAAREAVRHGAQILILDDGFQFWSLHRDFDLVLLDARRPFDNNHLLPRGHLREPVEALNRAHGVLLTRADHATSKQLAAAREAVRSQTQVPLWHSHHEAVAVREEANGMLRDLAELRNQAVGALSALADNGAFHTSLLNCGARLVMTCARRDHHFWGEAEVRTAAAQAHKAGARALVTTEKDAVKIQPAWVQPLPLWSLQIELHVQEDDAFRHIVSTLS